MVQMNYPGAYWPSPHELDDTHAASSSTSGAFQETYFGRLLRTRVKQEQEQSPRAPQHPEQLQLQARPYPRPTVPTTHPGSNMSAAAMVPPAGLPASAGTWPLTPINVTTIAKPLSRFQQLLNAKLAAEKSQSPSVSAHQPPPPVPQFSSEALAKLQVVDTVVNTSFARQHFVTEPVYNYAKPKSQQLDAQVAQAPQSSWAQGPSELYYSTIDEPMTKYRQSMPHERPPTHGGPMPTALPLNRLSQAERFNQFTSTPVGSFSDQRIPAYNSYTPSFTSRPAAPMHVQAVHQPRPPPLANSFDQMAQSHSQAQIPSPVRIKMEPQTELSVHRQPWVRNTEDWTMAEPGSFPAPVDSRPLDSHQSAYPFMWQSSTAPKLEQYDQPMLSSTPTSTASLPTASPSTPHLSSSFPSSIPSMTHLPKPFGGLGTPRMSNARLTSADNASPSTAQTNRSGSLSKHAATPFSAMQGVTRLPLAPSRFISASSGEGGNGTIGATGWDMGASGGNAGMPNGGGEDNGGYGGGDGQPSGGSGSGGDGGDGDGDGGDGRDGRTPRKKLRESLMSISGCADPLALACHFCRRRKLKCDGQRPTCDNCSKRNEPCSWDDNVRRRGPGKRTKEMRDRAARDMQSAGLNPDQPDTPGLMNSDMNNADLDPTLASDLDVIARFAGAEGSDASSMGIGVGVGVGAGPSTLAGLSEPKRKKRKSEAPTGMENQVQFHAQSLDPTLDPALVGAVSDFEGVDLEAIYNGAGHQIGSNGHDLGHDLGHGLGREHGMDLPSNNDTEAAIAEVRESLGHV